MPRQNKIEIENKIVSITQINDEDYICLTDMTKAKQGGIYKNDRNNPGNIRKDYRV
jgi:hypothetical protein